MKASTLLISATALLATVMSSTSAAEPARVWTSPESALAEDPDFSIQGEYGTTEPGAVMGVQVVAMGKGAFDAWVLEGGLPGCGWTREKSRTLLKGKRGEKDVTFSSEADKISGTLHDRVFHLTLASGVELTLPRIERRSPTLNAKPPEHAVVLFNGENADQWENGKVENGLLAATGCTSIPRFRNFKAHLEFRTPYKPDSRGQERGNSGVYYGGRWETQVLDSFGLKGEQNETGGIYSISAPKLNMCLPPLVWQTYDVEFTAATFDAEGKRIAWPRITVRLNGVLIHENLELSKDFTTSAPISGPIKDEDGPIHLQNHGNPVFFRNIWVMPSK